MPARLAAVATLSSKHKSTLRSIFQRPTPAAFGGPTSRLDRGIRRTGVSRKWIAARVFLVRPAVFHEPHPDPMTDKGAVKNKTSTS